MSLNYTKELLQTWRDAILDKSSCGNLKLLFEYVGYSNQVKTIKIKPNQNDLNVTLEPTVFEMDAVIVSTAFNKIQSQNVMKVEHKTIKELQQGTATLIEGLATIPGVSQVSTGTSIETSNTWFKWKPRISLFTGSSNGEPTVWRRTWFGFE
jgi:hypothetical protein